MVMSTRDVLFRFQRAQMAFQVSGRQRGVDCPRGGLMAETRGPCLAPCSLSKCFLDRTLPFFFPCLL